MSAPATRDELHLDLAGIRFHVTFDASERPTVEARFGLYARPPAPNAVRLDVEYRPDLPMPQPAEVPYPGVTTELRADGVFVFKREELDLTYDPARRHAIARIGTTPPAQRPFHRAPTSLDTSLRIILSIELSKIESLLIHSTGFGTSDRAVVFPAEGGGGKTTTARKMPPVNVLSDDQVALVQGPRGWEAHALPFVGALGRPTVPRISPLSALAFLEKSATPHARRLRPAEALARLLACTVQFAPPDKSPTIELAASLVSAVPVYALAVDARTPFDTMLELIGQAPA